MLILSIIFILLSNAVNLRRDISILYNRMSIFVLIYSVIISMLSLSITTKGVGIHGGLLLLTNITQIFHIFVFIITGIILILTSFYPRKV